MRANRARVDRRLVTVTRLIELRARDRQEDRDVSRLSVATRSMSPPTPMRRCQRQTAMGPPPIVLLVGSTSSSAMSSTLFRFDLIAGERVDVMVEHVGRPADVGPRPVENSKLAVVVKARDVPLLQDRPRPRGYRLSKGADLFSENIDRLYLDQVGGSARVGDGACEAVNCRHGKWRSHPNIRLADRRDAALKGGELRCEAVDLLLNDLRRGKQRICTALSGDQRRQADGCEEQADGDEPSGQRRGERYDAVGVTARSRHILRRGRRATALSR